MSRTDILLIEDNPHDAEMTITTLEERNITRSIAVVRDGAEALESLFGPFGCAEREADCPRVILLDLKLPKVNGLEVLKKIRSDERTKCIPVVVLTSSNEEKDRIESYRLGANSYIVKPVDFDDYSKSIAETGYYWVTLNKPPY